MKKIITTSLLSVATASFLQAAEVQQPEKTSSLLKKNDQVLLTQDKRNKKISTNVDKNDSETLKIINFQKKILFSHKGVSVNSIDLIEKDWLEGSKEFKYYLLNVNLTPIDNPDFKTPQDAKVLLISNGKFITNTLFDIDNMIKFGEQKLKSSYDKDLEEYKKNFILDGKYYTKERLIAGKHGAKTKIAIFSDPLCLACQQIIPTVLLGMSLVEDVAVYHFDVKVSSLHPTSGTAIKAILAAKDRGVKDAELLVYSSMMAKKDKYYDVYRETDPEVALKALNLIMSTSLTLADINKKKYEDRMNADTKIAEMEVRIQGTPTILIDGKFDDGRIKLMQILKSASFQ